jgi:hypothetical protein
MRSSLTTIVLDHKEREALANIVTYYLRTSPPGALADQRKVAEWIRERTRHG